MQRITTGLSQSHQGVQLLQGWGPGKDSGAAKDPEHRVTPLWCYLPHKGRLPTGHHCHIPILGLQLAQSPHVLSTPCSWTPSMTPTLWVTGISNVSRVLKMSDDWHSSVGWVSSWKVKGRGFNSESGHLSLIHISEPTRPKR